MNDALRARNELKQHFSSMTAGEYADSARRHSPELVQGGAVEEDKELADLGLRGLETEPTQGMLTLFRAESTRTPLNAYLASALTGLTEEQRQLVFQISDAVAVVCEGLDIKLYEPRNQTDPVHHPNVPDGDVFDIDRERVLRSDLLVYLAHFPSTGAGEELDFAYSSLVPIIVISHATSRVSRMVSGIPGLVVTIKYEEPEELRILLRERLEELRPLLVQRKLAFGDYDVNIVGDRVRRLRESLGLTREALAVKASSERFPFNAKMLKRLEESTDRDANPSLIQLREIATMLKTTVADLVEPNLEENLLATLGSWVSDRQAARFGGVSVRDRNKVLRRLLLRLIDSLESDE